MSKFNPLLGPKPSVIRRYGAAVASVALALTLAQLPALHLQSAPASLFLLAVMFSAWFGGVGPGLLAAVVSSFCFDYYFVPPMYSLAVKPEEIPRFAVFIISALFVGALGAAQRNATESLRQARDFLAETVQELRRTNEALEAESRERTQIENRLRRSEGYLAEAQRLTHTGSFGWSVHSGEIRWSDETFRIFDCDPKTTPTLAIILQRTHPDDVTAVKEFVERASREPKVLDFEHRLLVQDGSVKYIRVVAHAVKEKSGEVEFVGAVMDITSAKEAEDRIRLIIDTVPAQLWTETPEGVVDFVNRRWIDYTGLTLEQAVGSGWNRMVHPDDIEQVLSKWQKLVAEGAPREIETRLRRSDGEYRWFLSRCSPLVDRSGHILGWYGMDTDIHDLKAAEETLRRSEAYLAEAQRLTHTGSWAYRVDKIALIHSSEEHRRLFGFDPEQGVPSFEQLVQRIHPEDRIQALRAFENPSRAATDFDAYFRVVHPDGTTKYVYGTGHPVFNASGELVEYVGTTMDVTQRKEAEEALRQAQTELAHVNRVTTMGELTASLAHEVNQPIAAALTDANTCLRWLTREHPDLEEARAAAARAAKDATRAAEIISRVRLLFKKEAPERELVDANEVIPRIIALLYAEAARHNISVRADLAADLPPVIGDRVQLQQVLMNLIVNSIDAMKDVDGTRELVVSSQRTEDEQVLVSVSDTGVGLPPQHANQIFNAFFTTKSHGTGLGLRISRSIVESHGGRLWAQDNSPRGASFRFTLPSKVEAQG